MKIALLSDKFKASFKSLNPFQRGMVVGIALAMVLLATGWLMMRPKKSQSAVLVARVDLAAEEILNEDKLAIRMIPNRYLFQDEVSKADTEHVLLKKTRVALKAGAPVRWQNLQDENPNSATTTSARIPSGYRAFQLAVDFGDGLKARLTANDHIDIIGHFSLSGRGFKNDHLVRTLLQNITILTIHPEPIVLLTPEQVELLIFAQEMGTLYASLRHPEDKNVKEALAQQDFAKVLGASSLRPMSVADSFPTSGPQILPMRRKP